MSTETDNRDWACMAACIREALRNADPDAPLPYYCGVESVYHSNDGEFCVESITIQFYRCFSAAEERGRGEALAIAEAIMGSPAEFWGDGQWGWSR